MKKMNQTDTADSKNGNNTTNQTDTADSKNGNNTKKIIAAIITISA
jgi:hypothetical protein